MLIRDVRPWGGPAADVLLDGDRIAEIRPREAVVPGVGDAVAGDAVPSDTVEGRGRLALPAFSDVHVHLDSTRLGLPFRPHTGAPGVWAMMLNDRAHWRDAEVPLPERVSATLARMIAHGTTRVRSFAQVDVDCRLERFEAVAAARDEHARRADVQLMVFPQAGILREKGTTEHLEAALRLGADVIGGIDPCQLDRDPARHLDIVFDLAERHQVQVDVHLHEPGELGVFSTELIVERTLALGMQGKVTVSHGYGLGGVSESVTARVIESLAAADIAMTTVAPSSRTALSIVDLTRAGVRVGLGEDGQRDYWSPYGNGDMLDRTWQLAFTQNLRADDLIEHAVAIATIGGASIMSSAVPRLENVLDRPGLAAGDRADLVLVDGETVTSAVMDRGRDRTVIHDGRVVADAFELVPA